MAWTTCSLRGRVCAAAVEIPSSQGLEHGKTAASGGGAARLGGLRPLRLAVAWAAAMSAAAGLAAEPRTVAGETPAGASTAPSPAVVFATPGPKAVTLTVCNSAGCSSVTKTVIVLDPHPAVGAMSVTPARLEQGQLVLLDAGAGTGAPQLSYGWQVLLNGVVLATLPGAHAVWPATVQLPGTYTANLTVTNSFGSATAAASFNVVTSTANNYYTVSPCRALDTRVSRQTLAGSGPALAIAVGGVCGIPIGARAVAANVTAVRPTAPGFLSVYPADLAHPTVSMVNFSAGVTRANAQVLPLSTDGTARLAATASMAQGSVDLLLDVSGYFASP
jgi:PKD repeat protein